MESKMVLVADDDPERASAWAESLREKGYRSVVVASGSDVIACLGDDRPDLILLNLHLRSPGGSEVLSLLKSTDAASIPIVGLAPRLFPDGDGHTLLGGIVEFLHPDAHPRDLHTTVSRLIGPPLLQDVLGCSLCDGVSRESSLSFIHLRRGERVMLEIPLCESCGNHLEKHLKRTIPRRLMRAVPVRS